MRGFREELEQLKSNQKRLFLNEKFKEWLLNHQGQAQGSTIRRAVLILSSIDICVKLLSGKCHSKIC